MNRPSPSLLISILALATVSAGSATAAALITSDDIQDGTIQGQDIRAATISSSRLSTGVQASLARADGAITAIQPSATATTSGSTAITPDSGDGTLVVVPLAAAQWSATKDTLTGVRGSITVQSPPAATCNAASGFRGYLTLTLFVDGEQVWSGSVDPDGKTKPVPVLGNVTILGAGAHVLSARGSAFCAGGNFVVTGASIKVLSAS